MKLLESLPKIRYTREEEFALAAKIQKTPTEDLLNDLVLHNMEEGFIYTKKVCRGRIPDDELFSLVYKTLFRNAKRFRPGGIRFHAFAKAGLRGALSRYWSGLNTVKNATEIISFDASVLPASDLYEGTEKTNIVDFNGKVSDPEFSIIHFRERLAHVQSAMEIKLSAQERMIITLVYTNGFNFQEVGNLLGITRSAVQSMNAEALKKIRQALTRKRLLKE